MKIRLAAVLVLLATRVAAADPYALLPPEIDRAKVERGEVATSVRALPGAPKEAIAAAALNVDADRLIRAARDCDRYKEFLRDVGVVDSKFRPPNRCWQKIKVFGIKREFTVQVTEPARERINGVEQHRFSWTFVEGDIKSTTGSWTFIPVSPNKTIVVYAASADPGGFAGFLQRLIGKIRTHTLPDLLKALERHAARLPATSG